MLLEETYASLVMCLPEVIWILDLKNAVHLKGQVSEPCVSKHCNVMDYERAVTCEEGIEGWTQHGKPSADGFDYQHSLLQRKTY